MHATHKMNGRSCVLAGKVTKNGIDYSDICLEYTDIEKLSSGKVNGFHNQVVRSSKLTPIKIGFVHGED